MGRRPWATGLSAPAYWPMDRVPASSAWSQTQPEPNKPTPLATNSFWKLSMEPHCFPIWSFRGPVAELGEVQVVVQDLAGVVENGFRFLDSATGSARNDNLLQGYRLELGPGDEFIEIVHIGLQMLPVMELQSTGADDGLEGVQRIG